MPKHYFKNVKSFGRVSDNQGKSTLKSKACIKRGLKLLPEALKYLLDVLKTLLILFTLSCISFCSMLTSIFSHSSISLMVFILSTISFVLYLCYKSSKLSKKALELKPKFTEFNNKYGKLFIK